MADEEKSDAATAENKAPGSDAPEGGTPGDGESTKRSPRRKSVWVAIPVEFETSEEVDEFGNDAAVSITRPTKYSLTECPGGKGQTDAMRDLLVKHKVDPTNYEHVIMFRADPLDFNISTQTIIRF